jgi:23S rRNA-/tRNA-specific pseudouridylate synthase
VHRLDADTSGVLLFAKTPGAVRSLGELFASRRVLKRYLAVVRGRSDRPGWVCRDKLAAEPDEWGRRQTVTQGGRDAETEFRVLSWREPLTLIEARPLTGRTHQIRIHLAAAGLPIVGDRLYGGGHDRPLALRAVEMGYRDPFTDREVRIKAPTREFLREFGFGDLGMEL